MRSLIAASFPGLLLAKPEAGSGGGKGDENVFVNTFLAVNPSFKAASAKSANTPVVFENGADKGTKQWRMADVILGIGKTGANFTGAGIVRRVYPADHPTKAGKTEFLCQWPTRSIGPVRYSIIDVSESEAGRGMLEACGAKIVSFWMDWQKSRVKSGVVTKAAASGPSVAAVEASADMLKDLGIEG